MKYIIIFILLVVVILILTYRTESFTTKALVLPEVSTPIRYISYDLRCVPQIINHINNNPYNNNPTEKDIVRKKCLNSCK
jgi:hypothetical protein